MTAQWANLDAGTWDSVYANGDGIKMPTQRRTRGQLWEREAERDAATPDYTNPDGATAWQLAEYRGPLAIVAATDALWSCGYDDATGEPYSHDFGHGLTCAYCGETLERVAYVGLIAGPSANARPGE